jgi:hypothetical protein
VYLTAQRAGAPKPRSELVLPVTYATFSALFGTYSVVEAKILSKPEILETIAKTGYKFTAKNPMNSLNTLLYSDKAFKNTGGKFGPA